MKCVLVLYSICVQGISKENYGSNMVVTLLKGQLQLFTVQHIAKQIEQPLNLSNMQVRRLLLLCKFWLMKTRRLLLDLSKNAGNGWMQKATYRAV